MNRGAVIALAGSALVPGSGCLGRRDQGDRGPMNDESLPVDETPGDGYPPAFENTPAAVSFDSEEFPTTDVDGIPVPLAPIDAVYTWYGRGEARFVDARGPKQYEQSHIYGAVLSPAPDGRSGDPVTDWPQDDRIVAYCGCPHHLSSVRAAHLIADGYEDVYVIDEGFWEWHDRDYPLAGDAINARPAPRRISGLVDPKYAGESAVLRHPSSGQREMTSIRPDGSFEFVVRFFDITATARLTIETPDYVVTDTLGSLTARQVTGPTAVAAKPQSSRYHISVPR